jgi:preprotein translocase subunit SecD
MLHFSRWKILATLLATGFLCLLAIPNLLPSAVIKSMPQFLQRTIVLGLDLQGGSHILLEVDSAAVRKDKVELLRDDVPHNAGSAAPDRPANSVSFMRSGRC